VNVPPRIGLTGGIASGKSTVANLFAELGATVIDTDVIAREVVAPGQPALEEIAATFGDEVLRPNGSLDRGALRTRVFASAEDRQRLEAITHPRIREETLRQANEAGGLYQLIVVPLLVQSALRESVDRVLVVDCPEETQVERLMARDADSEAQARRILAAQASRGERLAIADDVIANDGSLEDTRRQVAALHEIYRSLA
jgi:dephospho-CoA kinase